MSWKGDGPALSVPKDFEIDKDARHSGTVINYYKWQGYGFIKPDQEGLVPGDKVWVHWSSIQTDDRYPFLVKDLKVEFSLMKWSTGRRGGEWEKTTLRAKTVTAAGGAQISLQNEVDAEKKEFVGAQTMRYAGTLKFYSVKQGYGYVAINEGYTLDEAVPKELRVEASEVNCGGRRPTSIPESTPVEFGIEKTRKGNYMVYNMTMPDGVALTKANMEHRKLQGQQTFRGTICFFHWRQGWGFIEPETISLLPADVQAALEKQQEDAKTKSKKDEGPKQAFYFTKADIERGSNLNPKADVKVDFKVYLDDRGAGAFDVTPVAGVEDAS